MENIPGDHALPPKENESSVEVVGAIGLAKDLLDQKGDLRPYNSWMGISTSKKTYPDQMVLDFARWGTAHSKRFMIVVADGMQVFNKMAIKGVNPFEMTGKQEKWYKEEMRENRRAARKRIDELKALMSKEGLENVDLEFWSGLIERLRNASLEDKFVVDQFTQLLYTPVLDAEFDAQIKNIVRTRAGHILERSKTERETSEFIAGLYPRGQLVLTMALSTLGVYRYLIKVGPEAERIYDELALDIFTRGFGTLRGAGGENKTRIPGGAVYLRQK